MSREMLQARQELSVALCLGQLRCTCLPHPHPCKHTQKHQKSATRLQPSHSLATAQATKHYQ